jgi:hypothetical protein
MSSQDIAAEIQVPATPTSSSSNGVSKKRSAGEAAHSFESPSKLPKHATPHTSPSQSRSKSRKRPGSKKKGPTRLSSASGTFSGAESDDSGLESAEPSPSPDRNTSSPAVVDPLSRRTRSTVSAASPLVLQALPAVCKHVRKPKQTTESSVSKETSPILPGPSLGEHQTGGAAETSQNQQYGTSFPTAASIAASQQPEKSLVKSNPFLGVSNSSGGVEKSPVQLHGTSSLADSQQPKELLETSTSAGGADKSPVQLHGTPSLAPVVFATDRPSCSVFTFAKSGCSCSIFQLKSSLRTTPTTFPTLPPTLPRKRRKCRSRVTELLLPHLSPLR